MPLTRWYTLNHTSRPRHGEHWAQQAAYDTDEAALFIRYKSGIVCRYDNIHQQLFLNLINAPSAGQWIHRHIYHYPYTRVATAVRVEGPAEVKQP
jgi:hypothetical protein